MINPLSQKERDTLAVVYQHGGRGVTSLDVADELRLPVRVARERLKRLESDRLLLTSSKVGLSKRRSPITGFSAVYPSFDAAVATIKPTPSNLFISAECPDCLGQGYVEERTGLADYRECGCPNRECDDGREVFEPETKMYRPHGATTIRKGFEWRGDRWLILPEHGCVASVHWGTEYKWIECCPMNEDGSVDFDNIYEVDAPEQAFLDTIRKVTGKTFKLEQFAGR